MKEGRRGGRREERREERRERRETRSICPYSPQTVVGQTAF